MNSLELVEFEGKHIHVYSWRGRVCFLAQDVSLAIGYAKSDQLAVNISKHWAEDFVAGEHFDVLTLAQIEVFCRENPVTVTAGVTAFRPGKGGVRNLMVLYEKGIDQALLLAQTPLGRRLRRYLVDEVFPALRSGSMSSLQQEIDRLFLFMHPNPEASSVWCYPLWNELARMYGHEPIRQGDRMPQWLARPQSKIYQIVLGNEVYDALKGRNPEPQRGSLHYQYIREQRKELLDKDMEKVLVVAKQSTGPKEFFSRLSFEFGRGPLQLGWFAA